MPFYVDSLFTNMLTMDSIRGPDSTGVFGVTSGGHVDYSKGNTDGYTFTHSKNYEAFKTRIGKEYRVVIGHNRKATMGAVTAANAHPFQEKHIIMVHNGTLRNTDKLEKTEVDSHAICHALADHDPVKALGMLDGAFALVWYDQNEKTLNLARNSERPLSLLQYDALWVISSEIGLPLWLQGRENRGLIKGDDAIIRVPEKKILVFKLDKMDKLPTEVAYEEYRRWTPSPTPTPSYGGNHSRLWPTTGPEVPAVLRSPTDGRVINLTPKKVDNPLLKAGEIITVEFEDAKKENGAEVILGNPVFDGEKDDNILVRSVLQKGADEMVYFGDTAKPKLWKCKILHIRTMAGMITVFVNDMQPYEPLVDAQGETNEKEEVAIALKEGCSRCKGVVTQEDVPQSIVRKKKEGWRIVCPACLNKSIETAKAKNPTTELRLRAH